MVLAHRPVHIQSNVKWPGTFTRRFKKKGRATVTQYVNKEGVVKCVGNKHLRASASEPHGWSVIEQECLRAEYHSHWHWKVYCEARCKWPEAVPDKMGPACRSCSCGGVV
jgi:hypothetical protein